MSIVQEGRGLIIADVLDCLLPCFLVNVVGFSASLNVGLFVDLLLPDVVGFANITVNDCSISCHGANNCNVKHQTSPHKNRNDKHQTCQTSVCYLY